MTTMTKTLLAVVVVAAVVAAFAPELSVAAGTVGRYVIDSYTLMYIDAEGMLLACL